MVLSDTDAKQGSLLLSNGSRVQQQPAPLLLVAVPPARLPGTLLPHACPPLLAQDLAAKEGELREREQAGVRAAAEQAMQKRQRDELLNQQRQLFQQDNELERWGWGKAGLWMKAWSGLGRADQLGLVVYFLMLPGHAAWIQWAMLAPGSSYRTLSLPPRPAVLQRAAAAQGGGAGGAQHAGAHHAPRQLARHQLCAPLR